MKKRAIWLPFTLLGLLLGPGVSFAFTEYDLFPSISVDIPLMSPSGTEMITFTGSVQFAVFFETDEGDAVDDDDDGRGEVAVEITSLSLTGTSSLGSVTITLNPLIASEGIIEEQLDNMVGLLDIPPFTTTGSARMRLDAFYLVEIGGGTSLFNLDPIQMYSLITHKPGTPTEMKMLFEFFYAFLPPVRLYEEGPLAPVATEYSLGVPEPSSLLLLGAGMLGMAAMGRRR